MLTGKVGSLNGKAGVMTVGKFYMRMLDMLVVRALG